MKDSFLKWLKKYNEMLRSGAPASNRLKKYVYHDQLLFLKKVAVPRETEDSLDLGDIATATEIDPSVEAAQKNKDKSSEPETLSGPKRKGKQMSAFEERIIQALEAPPAPTQQGIQDRHMAFFAGIVPSIRNFTEDQICDFQIGVLNLIKSLKQRGQTILANNTYLSSGQLQPRQAASHTISAPFHSVTPTLYPYIEQRTQEAPFHSYASTSYKRQEEEARNISTSDNSDASPSFTFLRPSGKLSATSTTGYAEETDLLSPAYSTISSEDSQDIHLFD